MSRKRSCKWPEQVEQIYREQGRELWALFYAQCNDAERASDALQESFRRLYEQDGTEIRDLRAWLLQVGRNWLRDVARRHKIAAKPTEHLSHIPEQSPDAESTILQSELQQTVRDALSEMKEADREVLVLRYSMNWSSIRIAEVLETTASAVDMRLSRARKRLAEILEKAGIENDGS